MVDHVLSYYYDEYTSQETPAFLTPLQMVAAEVVAAEVQQVRASKPKHAKHAAGLLTYILRPMQ
jgi:hypothetical protein